MNEIIKRELTTLALKSMLDEWKKTKSIEKAYDICTLLCEHFGIVKGTDLDIDQKRKSATLAKWPIKQIRVELP